MCKLGQVHAFYPNLRICMPTNAICFCFSEVKKEISLEQMFYRLFDTNFGKVLFHVLLALRIHLERNDSKIVFSIMIL